jgi:hypothetical protein
VEEWVTKCAIERHARVALLQLGLHWLLRKLNIVSMKVSKHVYEA